MKKSFAGEVRVFFKELEFLKNEELVKVNKNVTINLMLTKNKEVKKWKNHVINIQIFMDQG
jgi:hypothetical protein